MRSGEIEANLVRLNQTFLLPQVPDLIARKLAGPERATLDDADAGFHRREFDRLVGKLEDAGRETALPDAPSCRAALSDLLVRARLAHR